ncbi:MAG TPA: hypothetical protein VD838_18080, partial [Anaeromyxobacteraceae bacterium]|nr:hypothetical protein [Anaeromyxobacteraceae bacterium]
PFPLPKGRVENRVVNVRYEVVTEEDRSTLRVFNDPADGSYVLGFTMSAMVDGKEHASSFTSWKFTGETCEFEPAQLAERDRCLRNLRDLGREKAKSRRPRPGEPVFLVSEEVLRFTPEANREAVRAILEIMATSFAHDPETIVRATNQIERETGLADVTRYVGVGAATQGQKLLVPR